MNQKAYWNKVSPTKEFTTLLEMDTLTNYLKPDALIIDFGCGYGRTLETLWQKGFKNTIGYDFSEGMIARGQQVFPHLNLNTSKNKTIPAADNSVDMILLFAVLTCIIDDDKQTNLIKDIYRVLKPGGIIYINDFLLNTDQRNLNRYNAYKEKFGIYGVFELAEGAILRHHDKKYVANLTRDYKTLKLNHITFETMNGHQSNGFVYWGKKELSGRKQQ